MFIPQVRQYKDFNRFSAINPGKMGRSFWQAHFSDIDPKPDEKFTLDEAKTKLKEQGHVIMKQKAFDDIIDEKYGKGYNKGKEEGAAEAKPDEKLKNDNEKLKAQIEELKKEKPDMISKSEHEKLLEVERNKATEADKKVEQLRNQQKDFAIHKAAAANSVDPDTVVALLRDKFKMDDDGKVYPVDEKGERLIGKEGHVSPEQYINDFLKEKTYLAKDKSSTGAGSSTSGEGKPTTGKYTADQLLNMSMEEFEKAGGMDALGDATT